MKKSQISKLIEADLRQSNSSKKLSRENKAYRDSIEKVEHWNTTNGAYSSITRIYISTKFAYKTSLYAFCPLYESASDFLHTICTGSLGPIQCLLSDQSI